MSQPEQDEPQVSVSGLAGSKSAIPAPPGKPSIEAYERWLESLEKLNFPPSALQDQALVEEFTRAALAVTESWTTGHLRALDELHDVADEYRELRSRLLALAPDVDMLDSDDLLLDFGELRLIFSERGNLAQHLDDISRLSNLWNDYRQRRQEIWDALEPRFRHIENMLCAFTAQHTLPPVMLTIAEESGADDNLGSYHQGVLEINLYLLASSVTAPQLVETLYHELVHGEQDALVIRCIGDRIGLRSARATEEDLDRMETIYRESMQLEDWPSFRPFIRQVLEHREGAPLTVQEQWRAAYLIAAWHQGRCVIEEESDLLERLSNAISIQQRLGTLTELPHILRLIVEIRCFKEALCDSEELPEVVKTLIEAAQQNDWEPLGVKSSVIARDALLPIVNERVKYLQSLMDDNWSKYRITHDENEAWVIGTKARLAAEQLITRSCPDALESSDERPLP